MSDSRIALKRLQADMRNFRGHSRDEIQNLLVPHAQKKAPKRQKNKERERDEFGIPGDFSHLDFHA
jgi:hypothetical protein